MVPHIFILWERHNSHKKYKGTNYYKNVEIFLEGVWLWRISGGQSKEMIKEVVEVASATYADII